MADSAENKTLLVRYMLGQVSSEERAGLEERYFTDSELFEELVAKENDLIDAYARGELSGPERFQFESRFLVTPELRERIKAARSLAGYRPDLTSSKSPQLGMLMTGKNAMSGALRFAFSAMIVVALIWASWMTISNLRLRGQIEQTNSERTALQHQQQEAQRQIADLSARLQQIQGNNQSEETLQPGPTGQPIVSLILAPGLQRAPGKVSILPISSGVSNALLLLKTGSVPYENYSVSLETPEGKQVLKREGLKALPTADVKIVQLSLPSKALGRGDYIVRLFGNNPGSKTKELDAYSFRVVVH